MLVPEAWLWLSGAVGLVSLPLMAFLCLKIKSSKKDPAIMGVAGVISPIHDPEKAASRRPSSESLFGPPVSAHSSPRLLGGPVTNGHYGRTGEPGRLNVSGASVGSSGPSAPAQGPTHQHARTPSRTGDRRLPEIPKSTEDSASDLYATVEDADFEGNETDGPRGHGGTKREHPYAKVKKSKMEHPYATVKKNQDTGSSVSHLPEPGSSSSEDEDDEEDDDILALVDSHLHPPLNRSSRSGSGHSTQPLDESHPSVGNSRQTTPLPPEPPTLPNSHNLQNTNANFSGDSQDSSKGYTSITVREPAKSLQLVRPMETPYATLSETSDETYAAIDDPRGPHSQTNSETYAVIDLPPEESEVDFHPRPDSRYVNPSASVPPAPISRYSVAPNHTYSRIDRSRPRPAVATRVLGESSSVSHPPPPSIPKRLSYNVEEMYAKVRKGISRNDDADLELPVGASAMGLGARPKKTPPRPQSVIPAEIISHRPPQQPAKEEDFSGYELIQEEKPPAKNDFEEGYETLPELLNPPPPVPPNNMASTTRNGGYETVPNEMEAPYEVMPDYWRSNTSAGYETVTGAGPRLGTASREPGYEVIKNREADYDSIEKSDKGHRDPGYESVREKMPRMHRGEGGEPPYAQLKNANEENASDSDLDYETIPQKYRPRQNSDNDPQYEVLSKKSSEAGYETLANVSSSVPSIVAAPISFETASPTLIHMSVISSNSQRSSTSKSSSRSPEIPPRRSSVVRIEHMELSDVDPGDLLSEKSYHHRESLSNSSKTSSPHSHKHVFV
ncbi:hypothetical protein TCAL_14244 [Tigriopus californicus]|uniref:Uncharacterized protein n=1 Tax=Tigriopus californicus TaxID=6832 RepID=A0A553NV57_TIGCA|nr:nucleolar and coiled-body phosphoprotein 1-like [Tigriopus californicus]TRY69314.1 hypothetical protein TCAL_14244 [Tigriopus californicus]